MKFVVYIIYHTLMAKVRFFTILALALLCLSTTSFSFHSTDTCPNPKIIEYLSNYVIPTTDLQMLIHDNISALTIAEIKTKKVTFSEVKCTLTYTDGQSVNKLAPLSYEVWGDGFNVQMKWSANVSKATFGHYSFNVTAQIKEIKVHYLKTYVPEKKQYQITNVTYNFTSDMIAIKSITPNESKKAQIETVVKNQLYNALNQQFKSLPSWLNDQASKQRISTLYPSDRYEYNHFYGWALSVDTTNMFISAQGNDIEIGYKGDIIGDSSQYCPKSIPKPRPGYRMFISMAFIQSFAQTVADRYPPYKNILINASWVRTDTFQFRLADLEYVLSGASDKYGQYYMSPVTFSCGIKDLVSGFIKGDALSYIVNWACSGWLWTTTTTSVQIMDFQITASHKLSIRLSTDYLTVYSNFPTITDTKFNPVDSITVKDAGLTKIIMMEFLNDMRTFTPGTYFDVPKGSTKIEIVDDQPDNIGTGIWVG